MDLRAVRIRSVAVAVAVLASAGHGATLSRAEDDVTDSICDLKHWVHGVFKKDVFTPTRTSTKAYVPAPAGRDVTQRYHWFTPEEAGGCLKDKRVWVLGDSYMRNQFIGLTDVLEGNTKNPNEAITKGVPGKRVPIAFLPKHFGDLGRVAISRWNITGTFVGGRRFGLGLYLNDIKELLRHIKDEDLVVINALIHDNKRNRVQSAEFKGNMKAAENHYLKLVEELVNFVVELQPKGRFVWSTSTSYKEKKVPLQFRKYQMNKRIMDINDKAAQMWWRAGFPVLDVFHLTLACTADSCTKDGSHHNRMVNRAKAHVLLNHVCRPAECDAGKPEATSAVHFRR